MALTFKKETLRRLSTPESLDVAGGEVVIQNTIITCACPVVTTTSVTLIPTKPDPQPWKDKLATYAAGGR